MARLSSQQTCGVIQEVLHLFFDFYQEIISLLILKDAGIQSWKIILKFCIHNDQLPSDDGQVTLKQASMFKIQHKKL